jgi:chromate transporter
MTAEAMATGAAEAVPRHPTLGEATAVWAKIALMHKELVEERRWIAESRFLHALNFCMLLPGPEAQQLATYIGWLLHGVRGGVIAGTLFVLPGFIVIVALSAAYAVFHETTWLASLFFGLKAAVLAIVIEAVIRVGKRALRNNVMLGIAAAAFIALFAFNVPFPVVVLVAGIVGYWGSRAYPEVFTGGGSRAAPADLPAVIGQGFPEARPSGAATASTMAIWLALWAAPLFVVVPLLGWSSTFATLWAFFSQMAVVTFGGAYAVLAYVAQEAVQNFGWLQPGEMVDGLALAETTPGPLVMVLSFVGFLAAFRAPAGMDPLLAGVLGATLTTWVTFVPCFLWIFLGAPHIERLRSNRALSGALTAITAAVVGVILNLALWFGLHVLFRDVGTFRMGPVSIVAPAWTSIDVLAVALSVVAAVCLFRLRIGILGTLAICGGLGLLVALLFP